MVVKCAECGIDVDDKAIYADGLCEVCHYEKKTERFKEEINSHDLSRWFPNEID